MGDDSEVIQVRMKTPSGKIVPFADWVKTLDAPGMQRDIKKMLILINKASMVQARANTPENRAALEQVYYTLMVLLYDVRQPLPVGNEVK